MVRTPKKVISIITPCYNEEMNVEDCYRAIRDVFERDLPGYDYEHVFCDNVSTDDTVPILRKLAAADPRVKIILNARNFGILRSTFNGLMSATGDAVVALFPVDLQDPPELIAEFVRHWEQGYEVVYGIRAERQENVIMRSVRRAYYRIVHRLANVNVPVNVGSFQLLDRVVVEALRQFEDHDPHIPSMIASCGFKSTGIPYTWRARQKGVTKNRLYNLIDEGLNGMISFTRIPMRLCMLGGLILSALSIGFAGFSLISSLVYYRQIAPPGIPTLIVSIFFFSGVQLFFVGVIGEYISSIHFQVRKRPLVIERERINFGEQEPGRRTAVRYGSALPSQRSVGPGPVPRVTDADLAHSATR